MGRCLAMEKKRIGVVILLLGGLWVLQACGQDSTASISNLNQENEVIFISGDYPMYDSIVSLSEMATDVIRGQVVDKRVAYVNTSLPPDVFLAEVSEFLTTEEVVEYFGENLEYVDFEPNYEMVAIYQIRVLEVFQGYYQVGEIIEIKTPGGDLGYVTVIAEDYISFEEGDDLVFFIQSWREAGLPGVLLNPFQSAYYFPIEYSDARARNLNHEMDSVHPENSLTLTLEDLAQIYENDD